MTVKHQLMFKISVLLKAFGYKLSRNKQVGGYQIEKEFSDLII